VWALLTLYQLLRMAMTTAVETRPGTNPDRASFTTALQTARDQLTATAGIYPDPTDLLGVIRPSRAGHTAPHPPRPLQRLQSQVRDLPLPQPRRRPPRSTNHHHRHRHRGAHATDRPGTQTPPLPAQPHAPATDPQATDHRDHERRLPP
jgi:hypothetical protein